MNAIPDQVPAAKKSRCKPTQPLSIIDVPGARLTLSTLATLSGESLSSLYRAEKAGLLRVVRNGKRCTRVTSEDARSYMQARNRSAA